MTSNQEMSELLSVCPVPKMLARFGNYSYLSGKTNKTDYSCSSESLGILLI